MSEKQTYCPECLSVYKVTVPQLTVAQGMVCCPKCAHHFNAFAFLSEQNDPTAIQSHTDLLPQRSFYQRGFQNPAVTSHNSHNPLNSHNSLDEDLMAIFELQVKHSNLNLRQYLNHLDYLQHTPTHYFPGLNLSSNSPYAISHNIYARPLLFYIFWGLINLCLILLLLFQLLWWNPSIVDRHPQLKSSLNHSCLIFNCQTIDQRYQQMEILNLQIEAVNQNQTRFYGELFSHYSSSLKLPHLKISYTKNNQTYSKIYTPNEYLVTRLNGISRIPRELPYEFEFVLTEPYQPTNVYQIEILHP